MEASEPIWLPLKRRGLSAQALLRHFNLTEPPINVDLLARRMGVTIHAETNMSWSGRLESGEGPPAFARIFVNYREPRMRQRFTIAHEIGHLMRHGLGEEWRDDNYRGDPRTARQEHEANNYAAALLMPAHLVEAYSEVTTDAKKLATVFDVGTQAMSFRLMNVLHGIR